MIYICKYIFVTQIHHIFNQISQKFASGSVWASARLIPSGGCANLIIKNLKSPFLVGALKHWTQQILFMYVMSSVCRRWGPFPPLFYMQYTRLTPFFFLWSREYSYSISQEICTRFLLCCALLWLYMDWFPISIRLTSLPAKQPWWIWINTSC